MPRRLRRALLLPQAPSSTTTRPTPTSSGGWLPLEHHRPSGRPQLTPEFLPGVELLSVAGWETLFPLLAEHGRTQPDRHRRPRLLRQELLAPAPAMFRSGKTPERRISQDDAGMGCPHSARPYLHRGEAGFQPALAATPLRPCLGLEGGGLVTDRRRNPFLAFSISAASIARHVRPRLWPSPARRARGVRGKGQHLHLVAPNTTRLVRPPPGLFPAGVLKPCFERPRLRPRWGSDGPRSSAPVKHGFGEPKFHLRDRPATTVARWVRRMGGTTARPVRARFHPSASQETFPSPLRSRYTL